jgi:hypothetical protein
MTGRVKLTEAQREVLQRAPSEFGRLAMPSNTRNALWAREFIEPSHQPIGPMTKWRITDAGRAAITKGG